MGMSGKLVASPVIRVGLVIHYTNIPISELVSELIYSGVGAQILMPKWIMDNHDGAVDIFQQVVYVCEFGVIGGGGVGTAVGSRLLEWALVDYSLCLLLLKHSVLCLAKPHPTNSYSGLFASIEKFRVPMPVYGTRQEISITSSYYCGRH